MVVKDSLVRPVDFISLFCGVEVGNLKLTEGVFLVHSLGFLKSPSTKLYCFFFLRRFGDNKFDHLEIQESSLCLGITQHSQSILCLSLRDAITEYRDSEYMLVLEQKLDIYD